MHSSSSASWGFFFIDSQTKKRRRNSHATSAQARKLKNVHSNERKRQGGETGGGRCKLVHRCMAHNNCVKWQPWAPLAQYAICHTISRMRINCIPQNKLNWERKCLESRLLRNRWRGVDAAHVAGTANAFAAGPDKLCRAERSRVECVDTLAKA